MASPHERKKELHADLKALKKRRLSFMGRKRLFVIPMEGNQPKYPSDDVRDTAHDMRNPLTHSKGDLAGMYLEGEPNERDLDTAEEEITKGHHYMQIAEDAYDSHSKFEPEEWEAGKLVERITSYPKSRRMKYDNKASDAKVRADPRRLNREMYSLMKRVGSRENPELSFGTEGGHFIITLSVPEASLSAGPDSIPYQRAKAVAEMHGGTFEADHKKGTGVYRLRIPLLGA